MGRRGAKQTLQVSPCFFLATQSKMAVVVSYLAAFYVLSFLLQPEFPRHSSWASGHLPHWEVGEGHSQSDHGGFLYPDWLLGEASPGIGLLAQCIQLL